MSTDTGSHSRIQAKLTVLLVCGEEADIGKQVESLFENLSVSVDLKRMDWEHCENSDCKHHLAVLVASPAELGRVDAFLEKPVAIRRKVIVLLPPESKLVDMVRLLSRPDVDQVLRRQYDWMHDLRVVLHVLITGEIFGMEKYLPNNEEVSYIRFHDYKGRQEVLDKVRDVAQKAGLRRIRRDHAVQAAEELVMNALYNAPRHEDGSMMFGSIDPHKRVVMDSPKPVSLRYAIVPDGLFMSVRDRFGALTKSTVLQYIHKCLTSEQQIDRKTIGAGLGIYLTVSRVQTYIVNVAPEVATEVIVCLRQERELEAPASMLFFEYPKG